MPKVLNQTVTIIKFTSSAKFLHVFGACFQYSSMPMGPFNLLLALQSIALNIP